MDAIEGGKGVAEIGQKALALSAGGMFGAYQAGVYQALWPYWKPDIVVGTSVGALNGWPIASRIEPRELIDLWLSPEVGAAVKFRERPNLLRGGYFDPEPLLALTRRIQHDYPRRLPLGVVALELPRFRHRLFCNDEITPEHLLAACSILLFYPSVRIDRCRLVDGGLLDAMPLWPAEVMGAASVVAINALPRLLPWPAYLALRGLRRLCKRPVPNTLPVSVISPSQPLGNARESMVWSRPNSQRWIDIGIQDGERFVKEKLSLISDQPEYSGPRR